MGSKAIDTSKKGSKAGRSTGTSSTSALPALAPGHVLVVMLGDSDALDEYELVIERSDRDGLALAWRRTAKNGESGALVFAASALAKAKGFVHISQGEVDETTTDDDGNVTEATPPFLLGTEAFAATARGSAEVDIPGLGRSVELARTKKGTRAIEVAGKKTTVPVVTLEGEHCQLTVVDDPACPLVLERKEFGEPTFELKTWKVGEAASAKAKAKATSKASVSAKPAAETKPAATKAKAAPAAKALAISDDDPSTWTRSSHFTVFRHDDVIAVLYVNGKALMARSWTGSSKSKTAYRKDSEAAAVAAFESRVRDYKEATDRTWEVLSGEEVERALSHFAPAK